jgi:hypothetical protein
MLKLQRKHVRGAVCTIMGRAVYSSSIIFNQVRKGFVRMRHYGILASKNKATELNTEKAEFGLAAWVKTEVDWKTIAR